MDVDKGVEAQATGVTKISKLIDLKGGGELVELMKKANRTKNYAELEHHIREDLKPFVYNNGEGKWFSIKEIVERRRGKPFAEENKDGGNRVSKWLCCLKQAVKGGQTDLKNNNQHPEVKLKDMEAMPATEGTQKQEKQQMLVCWDLDLRGGVGETPLHICLLNATSIHADLAKWLLKVYPKLVYDIYMSDEFYGENVMHMAIVNEDPAMVKFLLNFKPDLHQRACGNFFTPDDQKSFRKDSPDHEWFDLPIKTNFEGYTYWGGFALGFAVCLGQEECVRLLIVKGADPNMADANGNTCLHLLVIHNRKMVERMETGKNYCDPQEMFDLLVDFGAKLHLVNRQGLTPLTLAAKFAEKDMYDHILELDREVYWTYGNVTCAGYPLEFIDTIADTGEINTNSAMYHVIYSEHSSSLEMIDGILGKLLEEKWKTFAKLRFFRRLFIFLIYFIIFVIAFLLRPGKDNFPVQRVDNVTDNGTSRLVNVSVRDPCYLLRANSRDDIARMVLESITLIGATIYVFLSLKEIYHQGYYIFFQTLNASPAKALFLMANFFVISMVPGRAACAFTYEDVMGVLAILCTAPYFLFFCRGFKIVGPFVVMIYTMIRTDLIRFFVIYLIFVIGFSQALYIIFRDVDSNIYNHPGEALMGMFIMSLGEFADIYESFGRTQHPSLPKVLFALYMVLVTLLLVNMLIAMMGNTYQVVSEAQKEWLRQWAKIILVVEQTVTTDQRRIQQRNYSQPMGDGRRALAIRYFHSEKEREEMEKMREEEKKKAQVLFQKSLETKLIQQQKQQTSMKNKSMSQMLAQEEDILVTRQPPVMT